MTKSRHNLLSTYLPALLLASLLLLPFLTKAHTIDDTTFLLQAQHVLKDPLHPTAFEMVSDGNRIRLSSQLVSGPVMAYLLVPSVLLGGAEWAAHLVQYLLVLLAILATVSLSFRLGLDRRGARIAGLLLSSTPAVMVMATTSMSDVPAMAFAVLGMERFFAWKADIRWHQCLSSALFFSLSALSRPHLLLILPIAALAFFFAPAGRLGVRQIWALFPSLGAAFKLRSIYLLLTPLLLSSLLILAVTYLTADPAGARGTFFSAALSRFDPVNTASNMASFFLHWILVFPLALLWLFVGVRWKTLWRNPSLLLAAGLTYWINLLDAKDRVSETVLVLAFIGAFVLLDITWDSWLRRDGIQCFLAAWLLLALPAIAYVQLPCKYLLASAPAAALLLARLHDRSSVRRRWMTWIAVAAGAAFAFVIETADAQFTNLEKRIALEQVAPRVARGDRVWVNGEWGFEWYGLKSGAIPVAKQPSYPSNGDILVSSSAAPHLSLDLFPNRRLLETIRGASRYGRLMDRRFDTGFYSNGWGFFPWTWHNGEIDCVTVWKIE